MYVRSKRLVYVCVISTVLAYMCVRVFYKTLVRLCVCVGYEGSTCVCVCVLSKRRVF